jgi:hypothetical protein
VQREEGVPERRAGEAGVASRGRAKLESGHGAPRQQQIAGTLAAFLSAVQRQQARPGAAQCSGEKAPGGEDNVHQHLLLPPSVRRVENWKKKDKRQRVGANFLRERVAAKSVDVMALAQDMSRGRDGELELVSLVQHIYQKSTPVPRCTHAHAPKHDMARQSVTVAPGGMHQGSAWGHAEPAAASGTDVHGGRLAHAHVAKSGRLRGINNAATPPPAIPDARFLFHEKRHYPPPPPSPSPRHGDAMQQDSLHASPRLSVIREEAPSVFGHERMTVQTARSAHIDIDSPGATSWRSSQARSCSTSRLPHPAASGTSSEALLDKPIRQMDLDIRAYNSKKGQLAGVVDDAGGDG